MRFSSQEVNICYAELLLSRPDDNRLICIALGMVYADCCQTMMNWFPAVGVRCSPTDGAFGNACAIVYTTSNMALPAVLAQVRLSLEWS